MLRGMNCRNVKQGYKNRLYKVPSPARHKAERNATLESGQLSRLCTFVLKGTFIRQTTID